MSILCRSPFVAIVMVTLTVCASCQKESEKKEAKAIPYLRLSTPRHVLSTAQSWEGNEFPHTMSVLDMKRGGFRYRGWYGLNEGRGIGLARSNDLVNWTKYEQNPLWTNACWPTPIQNGPAATSSLPMGEFTGAIFHYGVGRFTRLVERQKSEQSDQAKSCDVVVLVAVRICRLVDTSRSRVVQLGHHPPQRLRWLRLSESSGGHAKQGDAQAGGRFTVGF